MDTRFIRVLQKDIVTNPEQWKDGKPGKFIKLSNRAKNVYCVLSVIAFSSAGNGKGTRLSNGNTLGKDWFWTSHNMLQKLTGSGQKTVQRGIKELTENGLIEYHPSKAQGQKCYFKIKRVTYNTPSDTSSKSSGSRGSKKKFSYDDDKYILKIARSHQLQRLTPAQERRLEELNKEGVEKVMLMICPSKTDRLQRNNMSTLTWTVRFI